MKALNVIRLSGKEVLPLIEGGKGISITSGDSSGSWAYASGNDIPIDLKDLRIITPEDLEK